MFKIIQLYMNNFFTQQFNFSEKIIFFNEICKKLFVIFYFQNQIYPLNFNNNAKINNLIRKNILK